MYYCVYFLDDKKKDKKTTCPEAPIQHIITDTFIPSFVEGSNAKLQQYRPSSASASPRSSPSSSPHQPTQQPHNHQDIGPTVRNVGIHNIHHSDCHCCSSQQSGYSRVTQSSGYQSDYKSGYITDGDGAFESHLLQKATKDRPANLRMTAVRDYSPCCNEELAVRKGQRVKVLYRNHDWVFAVTKHGQAGYIPFTYVRPSRKYNGYQSEPEITRVDDTYMSGYDTDIQTTSGRFPFPPPKPRDIPPSYSINTGCHRTGSGSPIQTRSDAFDSGYMSAIEGPTYRTFISRHGSSSSQIRGFRPGTSKPLIDSFDKQYLEQLVVIHDFEAREEDEVFVSKGERVKVLNADDPQWLWVVTVHTGEQGFIPRSCCTLGNHPGKSMVVNSSFFKTRQMFVYTSSLYYHRWLAVCTSAQIILDI